MTSTKSQADTAQIRERSAKYARLVMALLVTFAVLLVLERFGVVLVQFLHSGPTAKTFAYLVLKAVTATPEVCYLLALWGVRQALTDFAAGKFYTPTLTRMLERSGLALAAGAFITVFLVPGASWLLGFGPGYYIAFDVSALLLGCIGLTFRVLADVLRRAAQLQAELDEMF